MNYTRLGQLISHESEWQLRDLSAYMGALLNLGRADDERNPLRAEIVGAALNRGIEAISGERESRRILTREFGLAMAQAMPECYSDILRMLQERGIRPVNLTVRTVEGPGNQIFGANSGYSSLTRDGRISTRSGHGEFDEGSSSGSGDLDLLAAHRRALASAFPPGHAAAIDSMRDAEPAPRSGSSRGRASAAADQQLMTLLRRLTAVSSRPGELDASALLNSRRGGGGFVARGAGPGFAAGADYGAGYAGGRGADTPAGRPMAEAACRPASIPARAPAAPPPAATLRAAHRSPAATLPARARNTTTDLPA